MNKRQMIGAVVAIAAAGMLVANGALAGEGTEKKGDAKKVKCMGGNSCKGTGACGAADGSHSCAGKNACKGKGWIKASKAECDKQGGSFKHG